MSEKRDSVPNDQNAKGTHTQRSHARPIPLRVHTLPDGSTHSTADCRLNGTCIVDPDIRLAIRSRIRRAYASTYESTPTEQISLHFPAAFTVKKATLKHFFHFYASHAPLQMIRIDMSVRDMNERVIENGFFTERGLQTTISTVLAPTNFRSIPTMQNANPMHRSSVYIASAFSEPFGFSKTSCAVYNYQLLSDFSMPNAGLLYYSAEVYFGTEKVLHLFSPPFWTFSRIPDRKSANGHLLEAFAKRLGAAPLQYQLVCPRKNKPTQPSRSAGPGTNKSRQKAIYHEPWGDVDDKNSFDAFESALQCPLEISFETDLTQQSVVDPVYFADASFSSVPSLCLPCQDHASESRRVSETNSKEPQISDLTMIQNTDSDRDPINCRSTTTTTFSEQVGTAEDGRTFFERPDFLAPLGTTSVLPAELVSTDLSGKSDSVKHLTLSAPPPVKAAKRFISSQDTHEVSNNPPQSQELKRQTIIQGSAQMESKKIHITGTIAPTRDRHGFVATKDSTAQNPDSGPPPDAQNLNLRTLVDISTRPEILSRFLQQPIPSTMSTAVQSQPIDPPRLQAEPETRDDV
eukprot:TRINITY_DN10289_c0_g1_i1.p1 TRINITY_DN10289_c0_g1~~TRINITY_DN10289_c0_g1_i1.p1  ORF type:complete len:575 (-),score=99.14 TRINITY_DN10289_c0_g1_i1:214-1938(-)